MNFVNCEDTAKIKVKSKKFKVKKSEDRRRKTEDGRRKTEDRRPKSKVKSQNVFGKNPIYPQTVTISAVNGEPIQNIELKRLK